MPNWWLIIGLCGSFAFLVLLLMDLIFGPEDDERPDDGLDIFDPRDRSDGDDATIDDLLAWDVVHEGAAMRAARLAADDATQELPRTDPEPTRELPHIEPSPLRRSGGWGVPAPVVRPIIRRPGPVTEQFGRIAEAAGHPVREHGPDEAPTVLLAPVIGHRPIRWAAP